jgi:hypothetical protein
MSSEIGARRLAALGVEVAVDDMIKKMGGAADYKGLCGGPTGAAAPRCHAVGAFCAREAAQDFDLAPNPMYNHAFSRFGVGKKQWESNKGSNKRKQRQAAEAVCKKRSRSEAVGSSEKCVTLVARTE